MPQNSLRQTHIIDRNATRYLQLKTSSYYLRKRFSRSALQTTSKQSRYWEFKFSLRTLNPSKALVAASLFSSLLSRFENELKCDEERQRKIMIFTRKVIARELNRTNVDPVLASMGLEDPIAEANERVRDEETNIVETSKSCQVHQRAAESQLTHFLNEHKIDYEEDGSAFEACVVKLVRRSQFIDSLVEAKKSGDLDRYYKLTDQCSQVVYFGDKPAHDMKPEVIPKPDKISDVFPLFLESNFNVDPIKWAQSSEYRKERRFGRARKFQEALDEVIFYIGDLPVHKYSQRAIKRMLTQMANMPAYRMRYYSHLSIEELEAINWGDKRLKPTTIEKYRQRFEQLFNFIFRELNDYPETRGLMLANPVPTKKNLPKAKNISNRHGVLSDDDLRKIATSKKLSKHKNNWRFWLYILLRATGARPNEIAQLKVRDVKTITVERDSGKEKIYYLNISDKDTEQSTKTETSNRKVPIHPLVIKLGFVDYLNERLVQSGKDGQLWLGLRKNDGYFTAGYSRWFTHNILEDKNIISSRFDDCEFKKVSYSTRATFATRFSAQRLDIKYLRQLLGHCYYPFAQDAEVSQSSTTYRYVHDFPLLNLYDELSKYQMPDLELLLG